jgi:hypothetical protein
MKNNFMLVYKKIEKKTSHLIYGLAGNGMILLLLGILIVWTDFMLRLVVGLVVIVVAYGFFYLAYKIHVLKKEVSRFLKM